jgi:hypothetical protein
MAIYNIFDYAEKTSSNLQSEDAHKTLEKITLAEAKVGLQEEVESARDRFFSSLGARCFFLLLLFADIGWGVYVILRLIAIACLSCMTLCKVALFNRWFVRSYLAFKRFLVAGLSLFVALISPALGIMFACTYFLMYDKEGIEEIVPSSLREQFRGFFAH